MHRQVRFMARSAASYAEGLLHKNSRKRFYTLTNKITNSAASYAEGLLHKKLPQTFLYLNKSLLRKKWIFTEKIMSITCLFDMASGGLTYIYDI